MYIVENSQRQRTTAAWQKVLSFLIRCAVRIFAVTTRGGKEVAGGLGELKSQWCVYLCLPGVFSFSLAKLICWLPATCSNACRQTSPAHRHPRRTSSEAPRYPRFRGSDPQQLRQRHHLLANSFGAYLPEEQQQQQHQRGISAATAAMTQKWVLGTGKVAQRLTGKVEARQVLKICRPRCQCISVRVYATALGATSPAAATTAPRQMRHTGYMAGALLSPTVTLYKVWVLS